MRSTISANNRRGITLLFVMAMIVLFLLMGATFLIVSNDYFKASKKRNRSFITPSTGRPLLDRAFYELLRGVPLDDAQSPLRGHSLLADMYGYGVSATVATSTVHSSGHFISLTLNNDAKTLIDQEDYSIPQVPGGLSGQVLGVVSGPARGLVTRIVDHQVTGDAGSGFQHRLLLYPSLADNNFQLTDAPSLIGRRVVINGRPFSGTGAGHFNPRTALGSPALSAEALSPNQAGRDISLADLLGGGGRGYFSRAVGGSTVPNSRGPNESYDTFDYQNMFLAGINPDGTLAAASFHRDSLTGNAGGDFRAFRLGGTNGDGVMVDNNNDGIEDGIWMDINLPVETRPDGVCVKPLVSYLVLDMDGRINVNAHGNRLRSGLPVDTSIDNLHGLSGVVPLGQGYGPAEVDLSAVASSVAGDLIAARYGNDGLPGEAGVRDTWSSYHLLGYPEAAYGNPIPGTVDGLFGSAMDLYGRFGVVYPEIDDVADGITPIGLPVTNIAGTSLANEIVDSPYEMTFARGAIAGPEHRGFDSPFTPKELERVFRPSDFDSAFLPDRLARIGGAVFSGNGQFSVTSESYEVPTVYGDLSTLLYKILDSNLDPMLPDRDLVIRDQVQLMVPPELFRGLPLNVNRPLGDGIDNNGNGVVDEIGEQSSVDHPSGGNYMLDSDNDSAVASDTDDYLARANLARHLYIVTLLNTERVDRDGDGVVLPAGDWYDFNADGATNEDDWIAFRRVVAQWAINVVDFRDRDSIMTPFECDLNPWNGWGVDGDLTSEESMIETAVEMRQVFWGAERPELLISETLVTHDRRTQDLDYETVTAGTAGQISDGDTDFDSHLVPKVAAFFELYNPWVMNDANQMRPGELSDAGLNGVDLQRKSLDGSSPVWRIVATEIGEDHLDPDNAANNPSNRAITPVRRIYFAEPAGRVDSGPEVFFPEADIPNRPVAPGTYAVVGNAGVKVGDRYDTYLGRRLTPTALDDAELHEQTRRISLDPVNGRLEVVSWDPDTGEMVKEERPVVTLPIGLNDGGWPRELGLSDPIDGYFHVTSPDGTLLELAPVPDGLAFMDSVNAIEYAFDEPVDRILNEDHYDTYLRRDGLLSHDPADGPRPAYRTVHLQRLANPLNAFNADTNPYLTVDSAGVDLFAFNGATTSLDPNNVPDPAFMRFGTKERRGTPDDPFGQQGERVKVLFKQDRFGHQAPAQIDEFELGGSDLHIFSWNLEESLGGLNKAWMADPGLPDDAKPFAWLTWNNRPYVSQLELANVPFGSSYWMTRLFDVVADPARDVYRPPVATQPPPVAGQEVAEYEALSYSSQFPHLLNFYGDEVAGGEGPSLHRVFDFLEVPSRFVGASLHINPATFVDNAYGMSFGLSPPFDTISNYRYPGKVNVNTVLDPEVWSGLMGAYANGAEDRVEYVDWERSRDGSGGAIEFANPLRPALASNWVPQTPFGSPLVVDPAECGLFRPGTDGNPLFDFNPTDPVPYADDTRAAYFRNAMRQRLGNLVTTRSSVFAIWVTIGYFEVDGSGQLRVGAGGGVEAGSQTGEVRRHRGFMLFDRSIPVTFEPGKNHNVDRAVLVKSIIE